jgi:glycosyltransferase involved in cell wall biosynthesis
MDISVIICTYNRAESLRRTLQSCRELLVPEGVTWELLIVDNNSTDHTQKVCEEFVDLLPLRRLFEPRQGKTFALNMAVEAAVGELVVFTDDDLAVDPQWLKGLWEAALRHPEISFFGGRVLPRWESPPPKWLVDNLDWLLFNVHVDRGDSEEIVTDVVFPGANLAFRASVFRSGARFHEEICPSGNEHSLWGNVRGEETEMERELLAAGHRGLYVPGATVYHYHPPYRCTEKYLRLYYAGFGVRLVRIGAVDIPEGIKWFNPPLWYWMRFARLVIRFLCHRLTAPDREWLKVEIEMATKWGIICEYRRLSKISVSKRGDD